MSAQDNLSPHQFTGDPYMQHAVNELALNHREWTGDAEPLHYTQETVRPSSVRFQRYPTTDPRVQSALEGFSSGATMPPVTLVRRAGETMTADGHHRLSAAEHLGQPLDAVVAHSPRTDAYYGKANIGTKRRPKS
jgi:hypothetical protein